MQITHLTNLTLRLNPFSANSRAARLLLARIPPSARSGGSGLKLDVKVLTAAPAPSSSSSPSPAPAAPSSSSSSGAGAITKASGRNYGDESIAVRFKDGKEMTFDLSDGAASSSHSSSSSSSSSATSTSTSTLATTKQSWKFKDVLAELDRYSRAMGRKEALE